MNINKVTFTVEIADAWSPSTPKQVRITAVWKDKRAYNRLESIGLLEAVPYVIESMWARIIDNDE